MNRSCLLVLTVALASCSSNQPVLTNPEPQSLAAYLASQHPSDIRVTDSHGGTHWFHNPRVDGDTLRGVRSRDLPQPPLALALSDVAGIEKPHFSTGKTLGLVGAVVLVAGVLLVVALTGVRASY